MRYKIKVPTPEILDAVRARLDQEGLHIHVVSGKRLFISADVPTSDTRNALVALGASLEEDATIGEPETGPFDHLLAHDDLVIYDENFADTFSFKLNGDLATLGEWMDEFAPQPVLEKFGRQRSTGPSPCVRSPADLDAQDFQRLAAAIYAGDSRNEASAIEGKSLANNELVREIQNGSPIGARLLQTVRQHLSFVKYAVMTGRVKAGGPMPKEIELPDLKDIFK